MKFLHPGSLPLLSFIAVFLIVCVMKPRFQERTVTSLYLWKLSERFRKKQIPLQRLKRALLFLLQLCMLLLVIALAVKPQFMLRGSGQDYVAILDTSASMRTADADGDTRFERAQDALIDRISALPAGSAVTVITTQPAQLVERSQSRSEVKYAVSHAACGFDAGDIDGALALAQELLWLRPNAQVELFTDQQFTEIENLTVTQIASEGAWNVALSDLTQNTSGRGTTFQSRIVSHGKDADVTTALYVDGQLKAAQIAECEDGKTVTQTWHIANISAGYSRVQVVANVEDSLPEDNAAWLCIEPSTAIRVLLVSGAPFYLESALDAFPSVSLKTVSTAEEAASLSGYDVYIFDGCQPDALPQDGSVWLIDPQQSPAGTPVVLGEELLGASLRAARAVDSPAAEALTRDLILAGASTLRFREATSWGTLSPVLYCGEMPVLFAGSGTQHTQLIVMTFDLHDSNLPLTPEFILLLRNMLNLSMPPMLPGLAFDCGEQLEATVLPFCEEVYLQSPDGTMAALTQENGKAAFVATKPGVYTLLQKRADERSKYVDFAARIPEAESDPDNLLSPVRLALVAGSSDFSDSEVYDDPFDPTLYLAAALLILLMLEWVVYNREQL